MAICQGLGAQVVDQISYLAVGLAAFRGWTEGVRPSAFL